MSSADKETLYLRADGNSQIGLGHIYRLIALAEILNEKFNCHFIIQEPTPKVETVILNSCAKVVSIPATTDYKEESSFLVEKIFAKESIVVLDGYHFDHDYQSTIKNNNCFLAFVDDLVSGHYVADIIINHAGGIHSNDYSAEPNTKYCLGPAYSLLRPLFRAAARKRELPEKRDELLICLGGADPDNHSLEILKKLEKMIFSSKINLILGPANIHIAEIKRFLNSSELDVAIHIGLNEKEMLNLMLECGQAITSPSTISYEYLSAGGALYLQLIADNQKNIRQYFLDTGLAFDIESFPIGDQGKIDNAIEQQALILDGHSNQRILDVFLSLKTPSKTDL